MLRKPPFIGFALLVRVTEAEKQQPDDFARLKEKVQKLQEKHRRYPIIRVFDFLYLVFRCPCFLHSREAIRDNVSSDRYFEKLWEIIAKYRVRHRFLTNYTVNGYRMRACGCSPKMYEYHLD